MYSFFLTTHNYLRWVVILVGVAAIFLAAAGFFGKKPYGKLDNALGGAFIGTLHLQLLLGLVLYFISPVVQGYFNNSFGEIMKDKMMRFYVVEHISTMIIAIAIIQIGRIKVKKAAAHLKKHKLALIFYTIGFVLILSRIPWWKM
jgi:hypothetical protein